MKWEEFLHIVSNVPYFTTGFVMSGQNKDQVRLQLSRWVKNNRIIKLRRGLFTLAAPYKKIHAHSFILANALKPISYVSLQSALSFYGMIPEYVPVTTSVTRERPEKIITQDKHFYFNHMKAELFYGFELLEVDINQKAFIAKPEKALLDLIYLTPGSDDQNYFIELRLQNLEKFSMSEYEAFAKKSKSPKLMRTIPLMQYLIEKDRL